MVLASLQASQPPARAAVGTHRSAGRYSGVPVTTSKLCMLFFFSVVYGAAIDPRGRFLPVCTVSKQLPALFPSSCLQTLQIHIWISLSDLLQESHSGRYLSIVPHYFWHCDFCQVTLGREEYISEQWRRTRAAPWIKTAGVWGGQPEAGSG